MTAKFLKGEDKLIAVERLRMNQQGIGSGVWKWEHVWEAMLDLKTWLWFFIMFTISYVSPLTNRLLGHHELINR
jgi:hypothetical protein